MLYKGIWRTTHRCNSSKLQGCWFLTPIENLLITVNGMLYWYWHSIILIWTMHLIYCQIQYQSRFLLTLFIFSWHTRLTFSIKIILSSRWWPSVLQLYLVSGLYLPNYSAIRYSTKSVFFFFFFFFFSTVALNSVFFLLNWLPY